MKNSKTNPIEITEYGTSLERQMSLEQHSIKEYFTLGAVATLFFVIADFIKLFMTWDTVQTESWYLVAMLALVSAVILDVPMMIAGNTIKACRQGLKSKKEMWTTVLMSVLAFLVAFVPSIIFSIVTKDATFQAASSATTSNLAGYISAADAGTENTKSVLVAAVYAGLLPLGTSIASLVITLYTADPLQIKLNKIIKARTKANDHLIHLNQIITEEESLVERQNLLMAHEKDLSRQFTHECYAQESIRIQAFLEALEEKCDPDGISTIIEFAKQMPGEHEFNDEMYDETAKALEAANREYTPNVLRLTNQTKQYHVV